jgi:hypothetical protein
MMDVATNTCYVYRHIRLDKNEPFYVGIGSDKKYYRAYCKGTRGRNPYWHRIVAKTEYEVEIVLDGLTYNEAKRKEEEFISLYGRVNNNTGILCNLTDGGEGTKGLVVSDETREKQRNRVRVPQTEEHKRKAAESSWIKIAQIDFDGNLVKVWDSLKSVEEFGFHKVKVYKCCRLKKPQYKGFKWKYFENLYDGKEYVLIKKIRKPKPKGMKHTEEAKLKNKLAHAIPIIQMTREGEFIKEWLCASDAGRELFGGTGFSKINDCCRGTRKTHKNFTWKYKNI